MENAWVSDMAINTAAMSAPIKLPINTRPQFLNTPAKVTPGRLSSQASGASANTPVTRSKPIRLRMLKPTGNTSAPTMGRPVCTAVLTAKATATARIAPAIMLRISTSRGAMKTFDSPASTIFLTNSGGVRYDMNDLQPYQLNN